MYLACAAMLISVASLVLAASGNSADTKAPMPSSEWGYLSRGPRRALQAAVFALVEAGALRFTSRGGVTRDGRLPADSPALERAIYNRAHTPVGMSALWQAPKVRQALHDLRASLVARGLVLPAWRRNAAGGAVVLALLTAVTGLVTQPDQSTLDVIIGAVVAVTFLIMLVVLWRSEHVTRAAGGLLRNMRSEYPKPKRRGRDVGPADTRDVSLIVALYGSGTATLTRSERGVMNSTLSESIFGDGVDGDGGGGTSEGY